MNWKLKELGRLFQKKSIDDTIYERLKKALEDSCGRNVELMITPPLRIAGGRRCKGVVAFFF